MLGKLLDPAGVPATHPRSEELRPDAIDAPQGPDLIRVMEPWLADEERDAIMAVLESGIISSAGPAVRQFEAALAARCGTRHAFAVTCGTHALALVLHCLDVGPGDEVIVPACTFISVGWCVAQRGARPVFVDVDRATLGLDPEKVREAIGPRTKGIIAVHTFGQLCAMDAIETLAEEHELFVVEDACEALGGVLDGRPVGGLADVAVHSFYANKVMTTGNGGAITTDSDELASLVRELRGYSYAPGRFFWHHHPPFNLRISALQAAVGLAQLERMDAILDARAALERRYHERLAGIEGLTLPSFAPGSVCWMYTVHVEAAYGADATEVRRRLAAAHIETRPVFAPLHAQPVLQEAAAPTQGPFPVAEWAGATGINLPSNPLLSDAELDRVAAVLRS